jgi:type IV pilus assembly protein PilV
MATRRVRGFALTEVLVAAALLGLGLLGQLALLGSALRTERAAMNLANAATLAADLAERLRANSAAALAYAIDAGSPPPAPAKCALAAPFDAPTRAACDLDEWRQQAAASLPDPVPEVSCATVEGTGAVLCAITIRWDAQASDGDEYVLHVEV